MKQEREQGLRVFVIETLQLMDFCHSSSIDASIGPFCLWKSRMEAK